MSQNIEAKFGGELSEISDPKLDQRICGSNLEWGFKPNESTSADVQFNFEKDDEEEERPNDGPRRVEIVDRFEDFFQSEDMRTYFVANKNTENVFQIGNKRFLSVL